MNIKKLIIASLLAVTMAFFVTAQAQDTVEPVEPAEPEIVVPSEPIAEPADDPVLIPDTPAAGVAPVITEEQIQPVDIPEKVRDTNIFRRTPQIDGVIKPGEWDVYETGSDYEIYANWDSGHFYFAVKALKPIGAFNVVVDGRNDGWYHGDDNYLVQFYQDETGGHTKSIKFYQSNNAYEPAAIVLSNELSDFIISSSVHTEEAYMLEINIPIAVFPSLKIKENAKIALDLSRHATPTDEIGRPIECTLVTKKFASIEGLDLDFEVRDTQIARGDELVAKLIMKNNSAEDIALSNLVMAGEGLSENYVNSKKVVYEKIVSGKRINETIKSVIPMNMPLGAWAFGAEVFADTSKLGGALLSFEIVEPYEAEIVLPTKDIVSDSKEITVRVTVKSNCRSKLYGEVLLDMPEGWECSNTTKKFAVSSRASKTTVAFRVKPPLGVVGLVPVKMTVTARETTKLVEGSFNIVAPK